MEPRSDSTRSPKADSLGAVLARALRLRCPRCGDGKLFAGLFRMQSQCAACGLRFERGPGFYLGSIYVNYGLTAILVGAIFLGLWLSDTLTQQQALVVALAVSVLFPLWFFRYARALWLSGDYFADKSSRG